MYIAIKSEIDSRVLLYQVIKALWGYGSVAIITSNRQLRRLIDDEESQGFRNVTVIVDEDGATDDIYQEYGIGKTDYDFVILDNVGAIDYDACLVALGSKHSEAFDDDVKFMRDSEDNSKVWFVQFGKQATSQRVKTQERVSPAERKHKLQQEEYDPAKKFHDKVSTDKERTDRKRMVVVPFPNYTDIEAFEGERKLFAVNGNLIKLLYEVLKDQIGVPEHQFRKEVIKRDEGGSDIRRRNSIR